MNTGLAALKDQIAQKEQSLNEVERKRNDAEVELQRLEQYLTGINSKREEEQRRSALLEWVSVTKPAYAQLLERQRITGDEIRSATDLLAHHRLAEDEASRDLRTKENLATEAAEALKSKREEFAVVQNLNQSVAAWQANCTRLPNVLASERACTEALESLKAEARDLSPRITELSEEGARLSRQIAEVEANQSELRNLLSQLQGHVNSGTCPLCGDDHGSKDELIRRIQEHISADAATAPRDSLAGVRGRLNELEERIASNNRKQAEIVLQLAALRQEQVGLDKEIGEFSVAAANLGIFTERTGVNLDEQFQTRQNSLQPEILKLAQQALETKAAATEARQALTNIKNLVQAKVAEAAEKKVELERLQLEASRLRDDPRLTQISLDIAPERLAEAQHLNQQKLSELKEEAAKSERETSQKKSAVSTLRTEPNSLKSQLSALRNQLANGQKTATEITARFQESKLPIESTEEMLHSIIAEEARAQAQLVELRDSTSNLELALDAATTAAALTRLQQNIRNKEKSIATATAKRDRHEPWLKYFGKVTQLVSSQQNDAIANFTNEYGPRTSVIQRRLRSVYGFDEIEMRSRESTISVRVKRHGEELRPTDYFSQSQQQTLLLALFLTACTSQTWSGFCPIFLDDPVTHFDDLNTYAFLDLINGLLKSDTVKRQFIISTCDEKLLQLARQKFHHLNEGAIFYRFTAIGPEGPSVEEINAV